MNRLHRNSDALRDVELFEDEQVWTTRNLTTLHKNMIEQPLEGVGSFIEKLEQQLSGEPELVVLLGAEALVVYYLFAWKGAVGPARKREQVRRVLAWAGRERLEDSVAWRRSPATA